MKTIQLIKKIVLLTGIVSIINFSEIKAQGRSGDAPRWGQGGAAGGAPYGDKEKKNKENFSKGKGGASGGGRGEGVPIDGGAVLLLAAGAGYGIKKLKENRKSQKNPFNH